MTQSADPYTPIPPPPAPPRGVGPDKWWNPLSPSWPINRVGRAIGDAVRAKAAEKEQELAATIDAAQAAAGSLSPPDPIAVAVAVIGEPSWGYYVPTVGIGVLSLGVVAAVGSIVYSRRKKKR